MECVKERLGWGEMAVVPGPLSVVTCYLLLVTCYLSMVGWTNVAAAAWTLP
jgi:hypothetical protein